MDYAKRFLNETVLVGLFTAFCYFLFILYEAAYLSAYGVKDSVGFIPLQIQLVIPNIFVTITITAVFFALHQLVRRGIRRITKNFKHNYLWLRDLLSIFFTLTITFAPVLWALFLQDKKRLLILLAIFTVEYTVLAILSKKRDGKSSSMDGFFDKVDSFLDKVTKSRAGQSYAVSFIMFVTLLPIFASSLGFIVARSKTTHYLVKEENAQYIVVRRYSDQVILVELSDRHVVIPNYKVEYIASGRDLVFRSEMIKNLNYSKVK